uniref:Uncharacterized protein n=1 Tax=Anguilla anguilla TaxID=7936 RepID=A0A0E9WH28_ANGAN
MLSDHCGCAGKLQQSLTEGSVYFILFLPLPLSDCGGHHTSAGKKTWCIPPILP